MNPVMVEIIAHAPTQYFQCKHCEVLMNQAESEGIKQFHADALETSLPTELLADYRTLSAWITNAVERFGGRVVFKVIDAASLEGVYKSLRYGARKYPAVIVNGKSKSIGTDFAQAETLIARAL